MHQTLLLHRIRPEMPHRLAIASLPSRTNSSRRATPACNPRAMQSRGQTLHHLRAPTAALLESQQMLVAMNIDGQRHHHAAILAWKDPVHHQGHPLSGFSDKIAAAAQQGEHTQATNQSRAAGFRDR